MSVSLEDVYSKSSSLVHRAVADEAILVPIRRDVADLDSIYALEGVGPRIWELVDGRRTVGDIVSSIVAEYDVDPAIAEADVLEFVLEIQSLGGLERVK